MTSIHPFPARMAPDLALASLRTLPPTARVLDPMTGSGTVAQQAARLGLSAIAVDLDPLAVLISKVSTTAVDDDALEAAGNRVVSAARRMTPDQAELPWLDGDETSAAFVEYWFGAPQRRDLRRLAHVLFRASEYGLEPEVADALRVALSRIIITKKQCASLAQDTSHSRPHRVVMETDYDVLAGFDASIRAVRKRLKTVPEGGRVEVRRGDARDLETVPDDSVDAVLTSPPYLNAIDYMRGHKMSLVWLGHRPDDLGRTRSDSIGAERRPDKPFETEKYAGTKRAMGELSFLPTRFHGMIERYVVDLHRIVAEVHRVLKPKGTATFVMGNSCLRGVYIENSAALRCAAEAAGLSTLEQWERELPAANRYLPTPSTGALSKRMRKEVILRVAKR
jgi:DNA modification methylase